MARSPRTCAIVLAAGSGRRAGGHKQFQRAAGRSLLYHACAPFVECREVNGLVVVVPKGQGVAVTEELDDLGVSKLVAVVRGGATRHASSRAGLAALPDGCEYVLLHDAARPFVTPTLIRRVLRTARTHKAAAPAVTVRDATVEVNEGGALQRYLPRESLRAIQTPQGFARSLLDEVFEATPEADYLDDAGLVLAAGYEVALVEGELQNWKITTAEDLRYAVEFLEQPARA